MSSLHVNLTRYPNKNHAVKHTYGLVSNVSHDTLSEESFFDNDIEAIHTVDIYN